MKVRRLFILSNASIVSLVGVVVGLAEAAGKRRALARGVKVGYIPEGGHSEIGKAAAAFFGI